MVLILCFHHILALLHHKVTCHIHYKHYSRHSLAHRKQEKGNHVTLTGALFHLALPEISPGTVMHDTEALAQLNGT